MVKKSLILVISVLIMISACNRAETGSSVESIITDTSTLANEEISPTITTSSEEETVTVASSQRTETPTATLTPEPTLTSTPPMVREPSYTAEQQALLNALDREGKSQEGMAEYPTAYSETWVSDDGIPFSIGLSEREVSGPLYEIDGITITRDGVNAVVDTVMRNFHYLYMRETGAELTYEQYRDLVSNNETGGEFFMIAREYADGDWKSIMKVVDPRKGVNFIVSSETEEMPLNLNPVENYWREDGNGNVTVMKLGYNFCVDETGKLFIIRNEGVFNEKIVMPESYIEDYTNLELSDAPVLYGFREIMGIFGDISMLSSMSNDCMLGDNMASCKLDRSPVEDYWIKVGVVLDEYLQEGGDPAFVLDYREVNK